MKKNAMPVNCAHRGVMELEPENTMRSFRRAIEMGAEWIETDVRLTRDGVAVISHDAVIKTEPEHAAIAGVTIHELAKLRFRGEAVPALYELAELAVESGISLNIEIKDPAAVPATVEVVKQFGLTGRCAISSFKTKALKQVKELVPEMPAAYLAVPVFRRLYMRRAVKIGCSAVNPHYKFASRGFVERAHSRGLEVNVWTVNTEEDMRRMIDAGVDMIITNRPDILAGIKKNIQKTRASS